MPNKHLDSYYEMNTPHCRIFIHLSSTIYAKID